MKPYKTIILILIIGALTSCVKQPEFIDLQNVRIRNIQDSSLNISLNYIAFNENSIKTKLVDSEVSVFYRNELIGIGRLDTMIPLPSRDTIKIPMTCELDIKRLSKFFPELLLGRTSEFTFEGTGQVKAWFGSTTIKFEDKAEIDIRKTIRNEINNIISNRDNFNIKEFRFKMGSLNGALAEVVVEWKSFLPFDYKLVKQDFRVGFKGNPRPSTSYKSESEILVKPNQVIPIPLQLTLGSLDKIIGSGLSMLFQQKVDVWIEGNVGLRIAGEYFEVPISAKKEVKASSLINQSN